MGGLLILLALSVVMALASFLAGALPLSMTLSPSQLRLISSIGIGILVGTSLIVIIPEGIEAVATTGAPAHSHQVPRSILAETPIAIRWASEPGNTASQPLGGDGLRDRMEGLYDESKLVVRVSAPAQSSSTAAGPTSPSEGIDETNPPTTKSDDNEEHTLSTFYIGFALMLGFVLMFLIDRLPRHATEKLFAGPTTRHISLDNLASERASGEEETESFLSSITPSPKQSRSLATTTGLVIHAAADGIAMGASATTANMELGLIIFIAIMVHKAPAAFGLTSVLLKQGFSKRAARGHLIIFSLAAPAGALITYIVLSLVGGSHMEGEAGQWWTGMLLLFSAGTFLYVAMHAMQEDGASQGHEYHQGGMNGYGDGGSGLQRKQKGPQMRDTVATVAGMLLPLLTQFGHHH